MSYNKTFDVQVAGSRYIVDVGLNKFSVRTGDVVDVIEVVYGVYGTRIIEESWGDCNPLMEHKCIRDAVVRSIEKHEERCLEEAFGA